MRRHYSAYKERHYSAWRVAVSKIIPILIRLLVDAPKLD